ncbi:hypothetical protein HU200_052602 [Digitaria exilis]|uniref:DUF4220 domain-containing protein n=1 Tax=Digitaria exilis TaxID=1010633 RepID=A0A835E5R3_9POAL|nr:hypothetical protein HU200_052602 [Digitaria exilis]
MDNALFYADMVTTIDPYGGELTIGTGPVDPQQLSFMYLLKLIRTDKGMHIDILATVSAVLLGFLALLGSRRRRCGSKAFLIPLWVAYTVSYTIVSYTIGLVQSFDGPNPPDSQLLWGVGLLLLLGSADTISAFSRHDVEQCKGMQAQHTVQTLLVLWLLFTRRSSDLSYGRWVITLFFLLCWVYSIFKMAQRIKALRMASSDHGLVRSAKVVADYMQAAVVVRSDDGHGDDTSSSSSRERDMMTGCKYLVLGEDEDASPPSGPHYLTRVPVVDHGKVVTIDMIWKHDGDLLSSDDDKGARALKDTCLSFALFKLLKRRFCGLEIAEAGDPRTKDFVINGLLAGGYERAFRVVEVELSFLYDFFYTKYPALFPASRVLAVVRFFYLLGFLKMLRDFAQNAVWYAKRPADASLYFMFTNFNDLLFVAMIMAIDIMQQLATGYSNWAVVHFVCDYVRNTTSCCKPSCCWPSRCFNRIRQALIKWVAARRAQKKLSHWDHMLGQYSLLRSFDYHPSITNALSRLTLRLIEPTSEGRSREPDVRLGDEVKEAVLRSLKDSHGRLTNGWSSVRRISKERDGDLLWACRLPTHTHTVLVWHIATALCDVVEDDDPTATTTSDDDRRHRLIATSLSGYCAYLLAFIPEMLPDHSYAAKQILDAVVLEARHHLGRAKDMPERCKEMLLRLGAAAGGARVEDTPILQLGARLGSLLVAVDKARRWKLLAEFWAELVLFLSPSDNADVHAENLARGGQFMTHLWALLTHAGILERDDIPAPVV